jgi:hypothetical protein
VTSSLSGLLLLALLVIAAVFLYVFALKVAYLDHHRRRVLPGGFEVKLNSSGRNNQRQEKTAD